jgi:hypothetical protein
VIGLRGERADQALHQACEILPAVQHVRPARIRLLAVEVIDNDQVQIGGRGHLAAAELAERQDGGLVPPHLAVQAHETLFDRAVEGANEQIRQAGEGLAGLLRRHRPGQDPGSDQEHVLLGEDAVAVEEILLRRHLPERAR